MLSFNHLHTVEEQENCDKNVVALIVFQVLDDPSSRFGHRLGFAEARAPEKLRPGFHLCFSLVEPFFSKLYMGRGSNSGGHFNISTDFFRRHSLFGNFRLRHHFCSPSPPWRQIVDLGEGYHGKEYSVFIRNFQIKIWRIIFKKSES